MDRADCRGVEEISRQKRGSAVEIIFRPDSDTTARAHEEGQSAEMHKTIISYILLILWLYSSTQIDDQT